MATLHRPRRHEPAEVAALVSEALDLLAAGDHRGVDRLLAHAVHEGVRPSALLVAAMAARKEH